MTYQYTYSEIQNNLKKANQLGMSVILGKPDPSKGFDYYYLLVIPKAPAQNNTIVMDCLNYNSEQGPMETLEEAENFYNSLFSGTTVDLNLINPETKDALIQRFGRTSNTAIRHSLLTFQRTTLIPIIPVKNYINYTDKFPQELRPSIAGELAPQIEAMFQDARSQFEQVTGQKTNPQLIMFGHSSSASFGNNFSMLYPNKIAALELGGGGCWGLPIDEISLKIVKQKSKKPNFEIDSSGNVVVNVTSEELEEIKSEYMSNKKDYQRNFSQSKDGTYIMPLNFPFGLDDIEHYRDLSNYPGGHKGFKQDFAKIQRLFFIGEHEGRIIGSFAYEPGITHTGKPYHSGDKISYITGGNNKFGFEEIELGPMHTIGKMQSQGNNSPDYQLGFTQAHRILFGKTIQEKWDSYIDLLEKLKIPVISKIYPNVGHVDCYSTEMQLDCRKFANSVIDGKTSIISHGADSILEIYQDLRHYLVSQTRYEYEQKLSMLSTHLNGIDIEQMMSFSGKNLTPTEIEKLERIINDKEKKDPKIDPYNDGR